MDASQSPAFIARLSGLAEVFDVKLSMQRQALYFEALRDLPLERVIVAMNQTLQTSKFFPRPAEIRALAVGDSETAEEAAWIAFRKAMHEVGAYSSVSFDDPALGDTILAVFGSWPAACSAEFSPEMWTAKRKEFGRVYRVYVSRQAPVVHGLTGVFAQTNGNRLDWQQYNARHRIGTDGAIHALEPGAVEPPRVQLPVTAGNFSQMRESILKLVPKSVEEPA